MDRMDRRRYFRINDFVGLSYRPVDHAGDQCMRDDADNVQITAAKVLRSLDQELSSALNLLWQNNPGTANVIGLINKKIDVLTAELSLDYAEDRGIKHETTRVNISACGMAFECGERFDVGQILELHLLLKPSETRLQVNGYVNGCERTEEGSSHPYLLRIDFADIDANVQEELIQHIVRRQSSQLGAQRKDEA